MNGKEILISAEYYYDWISKKKLPEHDETYELHRLLGALLSQDLTVDEKIKYHRK